MATHTRSARGPELEPVTSTRSIIAAGIFMAAAMIVGALTRHLVGR
jgi:hypothetical protein